MCRLYLVRYLCRRERRNPKECTRLCGAQKCAWSPKLYVEPKTVNSGAQNWLPNICCGLRLPCVPPMQCPAKISSRDVLHKCPAQTTNVPGPALQPNVCFGMLKFSTGQLQNRKYQIALSSIYLLFSLPSLSNFPATVRATFTSKFCKQSTKNFQCQDRPILTRSVVSSVPGRRQMV